jgi:hypothetical protein
MKKPKAIKPFEIISLDDRVARYRLDANFDAVHLRVNEATAAKLRDAKIVSQWAQFDNSTTFNVADISDVLPVEEDFINVPFRALSKRIIPGYWIDYSQGSVLEDSVPLLRGQTVYPNHSWWDIHNALGSVAAAEWDAKGEQFSGVPGINAVYKIDALMNPRISRGLLMKPPSIHSTSLTVLFRFDWSHPDLVEEGKFWGLLGQEVEGQIVRLVVTEILKYYEGSLVSAGADDLAKQPADVGGEDSESLSAAEITMPTDSKKEKTMKFSKELLKALGLESAGEDVTEAQVLAAIKQLSDNAAPAGVDIADLQKKAAFGDTLMAEKRANVLRNAKLAELGAEEGELDAAVSLSIEQADNPERLEVLGKYYEKKAGERFPQGRSSAEDSAAVHEAGGIPANSKKPTKKIRVH